VSAGPSEPASSGGGMQPHGQSSDQKGNRCVWFPNFLEGEENRAATELKMHIVELRIRATLIL
jgi:hypothetical protein